MTDQIRSAILPMVVPMFSVAGANRYLPKASITAHVSTTLFRLLPAAGRVTAKVIAIHTADFDYKGYTHHASEEDPQYAIRSDKTDHIAVHKGEALYHVQ